MNHLLRGKKALTSKTKRGAPQGVIPVMEPKKKVERKFSDSTGARPAPQAQKVQLKSSTRSLRSHYQTLKRPPSSCSQSPPKVETLHWKDTPRRDRRASLPSGVKLLEAPTPSPSALGVQDEADDAEGGSSTSTELCDDEDEDKLSDLEADVTAEGRPATTSPRLETVTELQTPSPAKQQRKKQEAKAIISEREKAATDKEIELKPEAKLLIKEPQEMSKPEVTAQIVSDNESREKSEIKLELELETVEGKLEDAKADIKPSLREEQEETETSIKLGDIKVKIGLVERSEEESVKQTKLEDIIKNIIPENKLLEIESQKEPETLESEEMKSETKPGKIKAEREAEMITSEMKPKEIKPETKEVEIKPEIKPMEIKPQFKAVETKPANESVEIKPEIKEITECTAVESLETKPEIISVDIKAEIKSVKNKPEVKVEPELKDITEHAAVESLEIKTEIKTGQVRPVIESVEIKPEIISIQMKPDIQSQEIKPEIKVEIRPESESVEVKPESKEINIKLEFNSGETIAEPELTSITLKTKQEESKQEELTPKDKEEEVKQEGKVEEFEAEDKLETVRAENKLPEMKPKEIRLEDKANETKLEKQAVENILKEIKLENEVEEMKVKSELEETKPEARVEVRLEEQSATVPDMGHERQDAIVGAGWEEAPYKEIVQEGVRKSEISKDVQENIVQVEKSGKTKFDKREEEEPIELKLAEGVFEWTKLDFTQEEIKPEQVTERTASLPLSPHLAADEVAEGDIPVQAENPPPSSLYSPSYAFSYGIPLEVLLAGKNLTAAEIIARIPFPSDVSFMKGPEEIDKFSAQHNVTPQRSPIETTFPDFPSLVPVSETSLTVKMSPDSSPSLSPSPSPRTSPISVSPHRSLTNTPSISPNITQETKACINWSQTELPSTPPESRMSSPLIPPKSPKITVEDEKKNVFEIHTGVSGFSTFVFHPLEETGEKSLSNMCPDVEFEFNSDSDAKKLPGEKVQKSRNPNMRNKHISDSPILQDTPFVETPGFSQRSTEISASSDMERHPCETTKHFNIGINIQDGTETKDVTLSDISVKHGIKDPYTIGNKDMHEVSEENDIDVSSKVLTFRENISRSKLSSMLTDDAEKEPGALTTDSFKTDTSHDACYLQSSSSLEIESQYPTVPELSDITQPKVSSANNESLDIQLEGTEICLRTELDQSKAAISGVDVIQSTSPICSSENSLPVVPLVTHLVSKTEIRVSETHAEEFKTTKHTSNSKSLLLHSQIKSSLLSVGSMDDVSKSAGNQELEQKSSSSEIKDLYNSSQANSSRESDVGPLDNSISSVIIPLESKILTEVTREDREFVHTHSQAEMNMYKTDVTARLSAAETVAPSKISLEERISALLPPETLATWTAKYECEKVVSLNEEPGGISKQENLSHTDNFFETNLPLLDESQDEAKILIVEMQGETSHSELCKKESEPVPAENSQTSKQSTVGTDDKADQDLKKFFDDSKLLLIENNGNITQEKVREEIHWLPTEPISKDKNLPPGTEYHINSDKLPSYKEGIQRTAGKGNEESALLFMKDEIDAQLGKIQYSTPEVCSLFVERSSDIVEFAIDKLSQETELGATKKSQKGTLPISKTSCDVKPYSLEITKLGESTDELASSQMVTDDESISCLGDVQEASQPPFRRQRGESSLTTSLEGRISAFPCRIDSEENVLSFEETGEDDAVFESSGPEMETDFFSEKDLSSEAIRQRLWRGVKSLSLDADITLDPDIFCFLIQQSTKSSHSKEGKRKGLQKRRNSEVELQELVKENTEIIERIMKQKSVEDAGALIYSIKETDTPANTPIEEHEHEVHSVKSNSNRELESYTKSSSSSTEPHELSLAKSSSSDLSEALSLAKEIKSSPSKEMPSSQVSSLDRKMSSQGSDSEPTAKSTSTIKSSSKTTKISRSSSVSLEGPMRPITFNPFPTRNVPRQPKEVAIKLGLYSPTKTSSSSPT
ncbi:microtubule-associated protein 1B-like isoform X2 [Penaeus chinensis]|nr:microtubule-associated protein 1B-like isoform X2 [Penaeus chinensis]